MAPMPDHSPTMESARAAPAGLAGWSARHDRSGRRRCESPARGRNGTAPFGSDRRRDRRPPGSTPSSLCARLRDRPRSARASRAGSSSTRTDHPRRSAPPFRAAREAVRRAREAKPGHREPLALGREPPECRASQATATRWAARRPSLRLSVVDVAPLLESADRAPARPTVSAPAPSVRARRRAQTEARGCRRTTRESAPCRRVWR